MSNAQTQVAQRSKRTAVPVFDPSKYDIKVIKEKFDFTNFRTFIKTNTNLKANKFGFFIQRNIVDDTFEIGTHVINGTTNNVKLTINNEEQKDIENIHQMNNKPIIVRRDQIKNKQLTKTQSLGITLSIGNDVSIDYVWFPTFQAPNKIFSIKKPNQVLEFQMVNTIDYYWIKKDKSVVDSIDPKAKSNGYSDFKELSVTDVYEPTYKVTYSNLYLVPTEIKTDGSYNKTIYKVYIKNDPSEISDQLTALKTSHDFLISNGEMKTNDIKSYHTEFNFENKQKDEPNKYRFVGDIDVVEDSYYDYDKLKVEKGFSSSSKQGDLVPFNLTGDYHRQVTMDLNAIYKDISITQVVHVDQPLLDPDEGKVKLTITSSNEIPHDETINWKSLDMKHIQLFEKEHKFSLRRIDEFAEEVADVKNS